MHHFTHDTPRQRPIRARHKITPVYVIINVMFRLQMSSGSSPRVLQPLRQVIVGADVQLADEGLAVLQLEETRAVAAHRVGDEDLGEEDVAHGELVRVAPPVLAREGGVRLGIAPPLQQQGAAQRG